MPFGCNFFNNFQRFSFCARNNRNIIFYYSCLLKGYFFYCVSKKVCVLIIYIRYYRNQRSNYICCIKPASQTNFKNRKIHILFFEMQECNSCRYLKKTLVGYFVLYAQVIIYNFFICYFQFVDPYPFIESFEMRACVQTYIAACFSKRGVNH